MNEKMADDFNRFIAEWIYSRLLGKTGIDRFTARNAADNAAMRAVESLRNDLHEA